MTHLAEVAAHSELNLMSAHALSICMGPCIFPEAPSQDLAVAASWYEHANMALELMIAHCKILLG